MIELLITMAVAAIVMGIAIPSFTETIRNARLTTHANDFVTAISIARSEAIKRGVQVTIVRNGPNSQQWEDGWDVFVDKDGTEGFVDDGDNEVCEMTAEGLPAEDCLLKTYSSLSPGFTLTTDTSTYQDYIAFGPTGLSIVSVGDIFRLCDSSADTTVSKAITINSVGRASVSTGTTVCP